MAPDLVAISNDREGATDDQLRTIISAAVDRKKGAHAGMLELARTKNRSMIKIGG